MVHSRSVFAALITLGAASSALAAPISSVVDVPAPAAGAVPTPSASSAVDSSKISPTAGTAALPPPTAISNVSVKKTDDFSQHSNGKQPEPINITVEQGPGKPASALPHIPGLQMLGALLSAQPALAPLAPLPIPVSSLQTLREFISGKPALPVPPPPPPFPIPVFNQGPVEELEVHEEIDSEYEGEVEKCEAEFEHPPPGSVHILPSDEMTVTEVMEISETPGGFPFGGFPVEGFPFEGFPFEMAGFGSHGSDLPQMQPGDGSFTITIDEVATEGQPARISHHKHALPPYCMVPHKHHYPECD